MYQITGSLDAGSIERHLRLISASPDPQLQLPVHTKEWWIGAELGLIQAVATWSRSVSSPVLVTYIGDEEDPVTQLEAMSRRPFGFAALMLASDIVDRSKIRSIRLQANDLCRRIVEMMYEPISALALGQKVFLASVDHSTRWMIPCLYSPDNIVRDRAAFSSLTLDILRKINPLPSKKPVPPQIVADFAGILHELFKNTDEWARTDELGRPWRRSVRGIAAVGHNWDQEQITRVTEGNPALEKFVQAVRSETGTERLRLVEFTVFDTGLGLARRWLEDTWSKSLSLQQEMNACLDCLKKHHTTSPNPTKGLGLNEVMAILRRLKAFLKIRTGRLSLYQDFASQPDAAFDEDVSLSDFSSCSETPTEMAPIVGTHFQILIPVI